MITVEDLLMAYASAYDAWLDPEVERKNPTPEYAEIIRQAVSFENAKLRELARGLLSGYACGRSRLCDECSWDGLGDPHTFACPVRVMARELGIEVPE